jgi:hypothetical protein
MGLGWARPRIEMTAQNRKTRSAAKYEPTTQELAALRKPFNKRAERAPRVKVSKHGELPTIKADYPDEANRPHAAHGALGTADMDFLIRFLSQLANASSQGREVDEEGINFMLSVIKSIQPQDQIEAMLAAQMAAVHVATMTFARRLAHVENIQQQDSAERAFNKRTYAAQMEALKRYRTGGEQKVTVQHVTVSEGGQAIVGNVTQGQRAGAPDKAAASPPPLADARTVPVLSIDESKKQAPVRRRAR